MTRPRRASMLGDRRGRAQRPEKPTRQGEYVNPTSLHGAVVHALSPTADPDADEPACGWRMRSVVYTSEPVNCAKCKELVE